MLSTYILFLIFGYIASLFYRISIDDTCHYSLRKMLSMVRFNVIFLRMQISRKKKREMFDLQQRNHWHRFSAMKISSRFEHFRHCFGRWLFTIYKSRSYYRTRLIWKDLLYMKRFVYRVLRILCSTSFSCLET